jgi:hypothetical protein
VTKTLTEESTVGLYSYNSWAIVDLTIPDNTFCSMLSVALWSRGVDWNSYK